MAMGRVDYHKFRLPYWDWRGEIQRSYGLPSEQLFTLDRFGETRNISNRPVVFGELVGDDWNAICISTPEEICNPIWQCQQSLVDFPPVPPCNLNYVSLSVSEY